MKETGTIDKAIFSMSIGMKDVQSKMTFGGYDTKTFATGELYWHDIHDPWVGKPIHWAIQMDGVSFKSPNGKINTWGQGRNVVVDSGTSYVLMPAADRAQMISQIEQDTGIECDMTRVVPYCSCT